MSVKILSAIEMQAIHQQLPRGKKRECANYVGILPAALSRYLNKYNYGWRMPVAVYNKVIEFISTNQTAIN